MSTREVTAGLAAAVVAAGPPPAPVLAPPWSHRLLSPEGTDPGLVSRWMNEPHVDLFWEQAWSPERWAGAIAEQLKGHFSRPYIIEYEGEPLAYVEIYRTPRDVVGQVYDADPYDLGIHLAIGDRTRTGRGLGREMVRAITKGLNEKDPRTRRVLADPDERHAMARRMFAGAGFQLMGVRDLGHKRAALHICDLSAERGR
ncbi:GNAT family N-acetyltransferase [Paractinoplanes atraurantiacus]|uniref:Lysine N-acyltransferase MbtK n=1 Tax=Paractinoplanes atraurantiacus TaxID=1036182 RepID=A0A285KSV3_9ACTN|nr:GNAT family N-acetyltransferase [Actinoplanes atraurantiacus]SNY74927.1 Protein N-acetyltransferase, RimJ/RimL family [Actinoplanes atraurantiacus]